VPVEHKENIANAIMGYPKSDAFLGR